jgi:hypothetical protein
MLVCPVSRKMAMARLQAGHDARAVGGTDAAGGPVALAVVSDALKVAIGQVLDHFPQIRGNRDIPVFPS